MRGLLEGFKCLLGVVFGNWGRGNLLLLVLFFVFVDGVLFGGEIFWVMAIVFWLLLKLGKKILMLVLSSNNRVEED